MKISDILLERLREELLLFKDVDRYRSIIAARTVRLVILTILIIAVWQIAIGKVTFDISFVLSLFSIFISWLFFWSANRSAEHQTKELRAFIHDFRASTEKRFDTLESKYELKTISKDASSPLPKTEAETPHEQIFQIYTSTLNDAAKQILIALSRYTKPFNEYTKIDYGFEHDKSKTQGYTTLASLRRQLAQLNLITFDATNDGIGLSELGGQFTSWLEQHAEKASFFESPQLGGWGSPSEEYLKFKEESKKAG